MSDQAHLVLNLEILVLTCQSKDKDHSNTKKLLGSL